MVPNVIHGDIFLLLTFFFPSGPGTGWFFLFEGNEEKQNKRQTAFIHYGVFPQSDSVAVVGNGDIKSQMDLDIKSWEGGTWFYC